MNASSQEAAKAAHLQMIQGVITRMATNSFALKTLSVALVAAFLAYLGARPHPSAVVLIGIGGSLVVFWLLDAQYLRLERLYRKLYDDIRQQPSTTYSMDTRAYQKAVYSTWKIARSWSVLWLYAALVAASIALFLNR